MTKQKQEAVRRLELMEKEGHILPEIKQRFIDGNDKAIFENQGRGLNAVYYSLNMNISDSEYQALNERIRSFEIKNNALVYMVQKTYTPFGTLTSLFFVTNCEEEWEMDYNDLKDHYAFVYVINEEDEMCSEFGSIAFDYSMGGITRVE